ncbi:MAG: cupredoxin domain-containing protein [Candidatus Eremiobacteraeota bacterium]|nr:cupredoxin domain-containing protein [Candidatus Eremiobacteraeota bacterium]
MTTRRAILSGAALLAAAPLVTTAVRRVEAAAGDKLEMYVFRGTQGIKGPDGKPHDTVVPANFVVHAGVPMTVTAVNYDEGAHTITCPELNLDATIKGGHENADQTVTPVTSTFTFTAAKKGTYRWYCKLPCDAGHGYWAMGAGFGGPGKEGFMSGDIIVL